MTIIAIIAIKMLMYLIFKIEIYFKNFKYFNENMGKVPVEKIYLDILFHRNYSSGGCYNNL